MTLKFAIITCSDTRSMKEDTAGAALEELIKKEGWEVASHIVVQDDRVLIAGSILEACDELWVFGERISDGMAGEIVHAKEHCIGIRYIQTIPE